MNLDSFLTCYLTRNDLLIISRNLTFCHSFDLQRLSSVLSMKKGTSCNTTVLFYFLATRLIINERVLCSSRQPANRPPLISNPTQRFGPISDGAAAHVNQVTLFLAPTIANLQLVSTLVVSKYILLACVGNQCSFFNNSFAKLLTKKLVFWQMDQKVNIASECKLFRLFKKLCFR